MITVINSTNRRDSLSGHFADYVYSQMQIKYDGSSHLLKLVDLPSDWLHPDMYIEETQSKSISDVQDRLIVPSNKILWVIPEYNGSIPGVLKMFVDTISIRKRGQSFKGKKMAMLGVAAGRAGNIRGLDHFSAIMLNFGSTVMPNRPPTSSIGRLLEGGKITDEGTLKRINSFVDDFIKF